MNYIPKTIAPLMRFRETLVQFKENTKAVAAVEFAIISPILLLLYIGTVEISLAVSLDRKISRTSSAIADLVGQDTEYDTPEGQADLRSILGATERIMFPYTNSIPCVVISQIIAKREDTNGDGEIDDMDDVIAKIDGSIDNSEPNPADYISPPAEQCSRTPEEIAQLGPNDNFRQKRDVGSVFELPDVLNVDGAIYIFAEVEYDHTPIIGLIGSPGTAKVVFDRTPITLSDSIFLRPRKGQVTLPSP